MSFTDFTTNPAIAAKLADMQRLSNEIRTCSGTVAERYAALHSGLEPRIFIKANPQLPSGGTEEEIRAIRRDDTYYRTAYNLAKLKSKTDDELVRRLQQFVDRMKGDLETAQGETLCLNDIIEIQDSILSEPLPTVDLGILASSEIHKL